jgi:hypothetical protein
MAKVTLLDVASALGRSGEMIGVVETKIKMVPNLYKALAHSTAALGATGTIACRTD